MLADRRPSVDLAELAVAVADRDCAEDRPDRPAGRVAVELHHLDLPRLDDSGLIEYDWVEKRVERMD